MVVVVDTQMLEREAELAALRQGIEAAGAGSSGFVLVSGPAGVGKTSLLKQGRRLSAERGLRVLAARGSQLEREYAFGVVRQLFEPLLAGADEQQRREWLSGTAGAAGPVLGQAPSCEAPQGDFTVLHALYWLTSNVCLSTREPCSATGRSRSPGSRARRRRLGRRLLAEPGRGRPRDPPCPRPVDVART
jgi:hypothetical protein